MTTQYSPLPPAIGSDPAQYAYLELQDLVRAINEAQELLPLQALAEAPAKPREGLVVYANGTNWNPGSGAGPYVYISGTWTPLHTGGAGGAGTNLSYTAATRVIASDTGTDATLPLVTSTDAGLAPASGGGTTNFLRADGSFAQPVLSSLAVPVASVNFNDQQATSFRIENRTSDPGTPTTGQIWLRTDL
jgi:hypothetical protein